MKRLIYAFNNQLKVSRKFSNKVGASKSLFIFETIRDNVTIATWTFARFTSSDGIQGVRTGC